MANLTEWRAPFQVNTGDASIGHQLSPKVIGLANGWFMVAWREQFGEGAPGNGQDIVAKIYDADGNVVFDYFALNFAWTPGDQTSFDIAPTHDGFVVAYTDEDFPDQTVRIERHFEDLTYVYGSLTDTGRFSTPQIAANLLPENDDIFTVYYNGEDKRLDAVVVDENDRFSPNLPVFDPGDDFFGLDVEDAVVLSDGNFAALLRDNITYFVPIVTAGGVIQSDTAVAGNSGLSFEAASDIASLADGGFIVVGTTGGDSIEIFGRIYDNEGNAVAEIIPIETPDTDIYGDDPRVAALPDGGFVIMFEENRSQYYAQVFNADGSSANAPFLVTDGGFFGPDQPEMSVTADGRIVFVWRGPDGVGSNKEIFSSIWDPRGKVIDPDDYGQLRANILATDAITTGINGSIVLEGEIGDIILGQGGDDTIYTSGSGDFWGGGGDDLFVLSATFPLPGDFRYINGETGVDTLDTRAVAVDYTIDLQTGSASHPGTPSTADEEFANIENLITGEGDDRIFGSDRENVIETNGGDDAVFGGLGNDVLRGGLGNDTLNGEVGDDRLNGGAGEDVLNGGLGNDVIYAGAGNDFTNGGEGDDEVMGMAGNDTIDGGAGNDLLRGSAGLDLIIGGTGNDTVFGGDDNDTIRGGAGDDTLNGSKGEDFVDGEGGNDTLRGGANSDTLRGGDGNDVLRGEGGNDFLNGGNDEDLMFGSAGEDTILGGNGNDTLEGNQQADDLFGEAGDDILRGGDGFDFLDGGTGNDVLAGGNGNDMLIGGLGVDTLRGNAQSDTFDFNSTAESTIDSLDLIDGFDGAGVAGGDIIDLSTIDADTTVAGDQAFIFLGAVSSAVGTGFGPGSLWVENFGGQTRLFGNTDADSAIEFAVRINDGPGTVASDYTEADFIL